MTTAVSRHFALAGAHNFRDFGGYITESGQRVRWRRLFRSDRLSSLTVEDYGVLNELNIDLVCDLRRRSELDHAPTLWHGDRKPELLHLPFFVDNGMQGLRDAARDAGASNDPEALRQAMIELYRRLVTDEGVFARYRELLARLDRLEDNAILIHCSGGKDRTGISCALIQGMLGVRREDIFHDYLLTLTYYVPKIKPSAKTSQVFEFQGDWNPAALMPIFTVEPSYLEASFAILDKNYASVEEFLTGPVGVDPALIARLRNRLLEPVSD